MNTQAVDESTVAASLNKARDSLNAAVAMYMKSRDELHATIIQVRRDGVMCVNEMAQVLGESRNYVDRIWSTRPDRACVETEAYRYSVNDVEGNRKALVALTEAKAEHRRNANILSAARAERNRQVVMAYTSKVLGPSSIAAESGVDRNHVLRIARRNGVGPVHRTEPRNQYTKKN